MNRTEIKKHFIATTVAFLPFIFTTTVTDVQAKFDWGETINRAMNDGFWPGISKGFAITWPYFLLAFVIAFINGKLKRHKKNKKGGRNESKRNFY